MDAAQRLSHQSLCYYQAIIDVITRRLPKNRTRAQLAKVVTELYVQTAGGVEQPLRPKGWFRPVRLTSSL